MASLYQASAALNRSPQVRGDGLEIVTVALDTGGPEAARPWIEAASPEHPSLLDPAHVLDELLGVVNVPNGAWIDEEGMLVRPVEPAFPGRSPATTRHSPTCSETSGGSCLASSESSRAGSGG